MVAQFKMREEYLLLKLHNYVLKEYINVKQEQALDYLDLKNDQVRHLPFGIPKGTVTMATCFISDSLPSKS